jgi:hypothetical protein
MVIIQMWINGSYKGYRTVSKGFYERLKNQKKMDVQVVLVKELKSAEGVH